VASQFTAASSPAEIYTTATSGTNNLIAGATTFNSYLNVRSARTLPTIIVLQSDFSALNVANTICKGADIALTASAWGTEVDFKWDVFQATNAADKGASTNLVFSSSLQNPVTTYGFPTTGTYLVRYQVKESCCGWSIPVFQQITVVDPMHIALTAGSTTICHGNSAVITGTVTANGAWTATLSDGTTTSGTG